MADPEPGRQVVLIRYGELALKGANRAAFERALERNLEATLRRVGHFSVERLYGRLVVVPRDDEAHVEAAERAAARVFGIVGSARAYRVPLDMDAIRRAATLLVESRWPQGRDGDGMAFKVAARRSQRSFAYDSMAINREVGASLLQAFGPRLRVDVHHPELTVHVEVRERDAFVYADDLPGPGGLPVGVSGRALSLLSGGIDSPVASWLAMKRGLRVGAVHFHAMPFTSEKAREKVLRLARLLGSWQGQFTLFMTRFTEAQKAIYRACPAEVGVLLMRRMMMRIACVLSARHGYQALVTGESLGQVASQTLPSMAAVERASDRIVLRPLLTYDKAETVALARRIGTYDVSVEPYEDCCTLFVARHPQTRPKVADLERFESTLPVDDLVRQAVDQTEVLEAGDEHDAARDATGAPGPG